MLIDVNSSVSIKSHYIFESIADADYAYDPTLLTNLPIQSKFQRHSLKKTTGGISLYVNANKIEYMCFKQEGLISNLSGLPLQLVHPFRYLSSNISSTERDVNIFLVKAGNTIDWLSGIRKFHLSDKIKMNFFPVVLRIS